jgi:uncharacterized protein YuzE
MKLSYDPETDSLYISLNERSSVDSLEVARDFVVDFDDQGRVVGLDIQYASKTIDLTKLEADSLPIAG